jgi:hypothetical protein
MAPALPLRAALKRGALLAAANWPVVLIDFTIETLYKFALAVPVAGGALMVAAMLGGDVRTIVGEGVRSAADLILTAFAGAPLALASFLAAVALVASGGGLVMIAIKMGTLAILVDADRVAGDIERGAISLAALRRASAYRPDAVMAAVRRFGGRAMGLAVGLGAAYVVIAGGWLLIVSASLQLASVPRWAATWPLFVLAATSAAVVCVVAANLVYDLLRVIVVTEDCRLRPAATRLRAFAAADAHQILGIFGVVTLILLAGYAAAAPAMAVFTFVAWVPVVGLIAAPLQIAGWLVQGIVFQYVGLAAVAAYQTQYRRILAAGAPPRPTLVQHGT